MKELSEVIEIIESWGFKYYENIDSYLKESKYCNCTIRCCIDSNKDIVFFMNTPYGNAYKTISADMIASKRLSFIHIVEVLTNEICKLIYMKIKEVILK